MSILDRLATNLGRRDDVPNQELAKELAQKKDTANIQLLIQNLSHPDANIQSDCIKVLYEIGYLAPELIADYAPTFLDLLQSKNNRLVWGAMIALSTIAHLKADYLFKNIEQIKKAILNGSVITVDRGIKTLSTVANQKEHYREALLPFLLDQLNQCKAKDLARNAEVIAPVLNDQARTSFVNILKKRIREISSSSSKKRIEKILKKI